uniref:Putative disease resistance protein n=1 Tax=Solanum demissum TaxID=50514 RepID=Q6L4J5_SOLDE|nr:putative disease resistance protein [Solanum demissum]
MAADSCNAVIKGIDSVKSRHLGNLVNNELEGAKKQLKFVAEFLKQLEKRTPENRLSAQIESLFEEAHNDFYEIWCHMNNEGRTKVTIRMISKVLKKLKPAFIARRIKDSKPLRSTIGITVEMMTFVDSLLESVLVLWNCMKDFITPRITKVEVLEKKLISLRFLIFTAYSCVYEDETTMSDLFTHAEGVAYTAAHLSFLYLDPESVVHSEFSKLLETVSPFGPELRQIYTCVLKCRSNLSGSKTPMIAHEVVEGFLCSLREDLEELLSRDDSLKVAFDDHMQWLQQGLVYLGTFLLNLPTPCTQDQKRFSLLSHIEDVASEAAILVYSLYDEDVDKTTHFPLQVKFNHVKIEGEMIKLHETTAVDSLKDLIDEVQQELMFLRTFLMDSLQQCIVQAKITDVLSLVLYVTTEAGSVVNSLSNDLEQGDLVREMDIAYCQLILKFKFVNAVIRQTCPVIFDSSESNHPMRKLLDFLPINFDVIDSYFSMLKSSKTSSFGSAKIDEVLMGFLEYILDHLQELLNDEGSLIVATTNEVKKFYQGLLLLVAFFIDTSIQYTECERQNDLLTEIETIVIEAESAVNSLFKTTEVEHVLFHLKVKLNLIKVESGLIELRKHEATVISPLKDLIVNVKDELIFWRSFLMDSLEQTKGKTKITVPFSVQIKLNHIKVESSLIELLKHGVTMISPLKGLIEDVQEELIFLRTFLMDSLEQCKEQTQISDVLTMVQSVTTGAGFLISSRYFNSNRGDLDGEINLLHFALLLMFKFIKAVIRQMCPVISASTTVIDHPLINLLNFVPINFEVIYSYFSMLKSTKTIYLSSPKMDDVLMVFLDYILNNISVLLKDETNLFVTAANEVKKFYQGLLLIVTFIADPPSQYIECKNKNDLLMEIETIAIEAEFAVRSSYEDHSVLLPLQLKLNCVMAESSLTKLLKHTDMDPLKNLIVNVKEELIFLRTFFMDSLEQCQGETKIILPFPLQVKLNHVKVESSLIELQIHEATLMAPLKDLLDNVKGELIFLRVFLMDWFDKCKEQTKITDVLTLVQSVTTDTGSLINFLSHNSKQGNLSWEISLLHFGLFLKFKFIKRVIGQMCPIISASSTPDDAAINLLEFIPINFEVIRSYFSKLKFSKTSFIGIPRMDEFLMEFLEYILDNLCELLKDEADLRFHEVKKFYQGLLLIETFLADLPVECKKQQELLTEIENIAIEAETAVSSCCEKTTEADHVLFPLQVKLNHIKCHEQSKTTDVLSLIQSVTTEAGSVINSLSRNSKQGGSAKEINLSHFQLLLKFKFIKAAIRQMCPIASASSSSNHLIMINLLNFFPFDFEVIDSYFSMLKSSKASSLGSSKMDEIFIGLHEYILASLKVLTNNETNVVFTDKRKMFYQGLLLLVTFLVDPPNQYIEYIQQNDLLTEIETIALEATDVIRSSYEDAVNRNESKKVNLEIKLLTVAFKLIKSEGNLTHLLKHKATLEAQIIPLIEDTHEELVFLRAFLIDLLRQHKELYKLHDILVHAEVTAHNAVLISGSCCEEMSLSLVVLLREIKSVKAEVRSVCFEDLDASPCNMTKTNVEGLVKFLPNNLDRVFTCDAGSIPFMKNQIPVVQENLVCLGSFLEHIVQHRDMHRELKDLVERVQEVVNSSKYVIFFSVSCDNPVWYHLLYLYDVKQVLKFVEEEVKMICFKVPDSSLFGFSKTSGLGFLNCFLGKLEELLHSKLDLITELKHQIGSVKEELIHLRSFLSHFSENNGEHDDVYGLVTSVTEMAYKSEYVIDSCLSISYPLWYKFHWISEVVENIKLLNKDVSEIFGRKHIEVTLHEVAKTSTYLIEPSLLANTPTENEEMVLFQDVMEKIKKQLLGGSSQLDVISIVGMPGLGKTTLAEQIYNDQIVAGYFDVHGKCHVTQAYSWRELLLTLLNDVEPSDHTKKADDQLAKELRQVLLTKRFLILIDDVWDTKAWDYLHMCFQGIKNGSRIILTTRLSDVAHYAKCESNPHDLPLLRDDESWKLLQKKVFHGDNCPSELGDVGFRIAKSCGRLPLFIVLVAGVLKEKNNKADLWKEVEESLDELNIGSLEESMSIIGFSYGFVLENKEKGLEAVAQDFLKNLISRNLVMDMEKRFNGTLKTCRVHNLLHKFCLEKAKQENFLLWIYRDDDADARIYPDKPEEYRLSIHSCRDEFAEWHPHRSSIRSLLFNATSDDQYTTMARDISFILNSFKLVKVLDLESINIGYTFPSEIESLIHMKYFAARTGADSIPSSIAKLWNLETFIIKGMRGQVTLPCSLLNMTKLRHIHVNDRASFNLDTMSESLANSQLANLQTFSTPYVSYGEDVEIILRKMPNLTKLKCIVGCSRKWRRECVLIPRLDFLSRLESLNLFSNNCPVECLRGFNFPSELRELTLSNFCLPWSEISIVGTLCNLEVLKLLNKAFEGVQWNVNDTEFPQLRYLKLDSLNFAQWSISEDSFPSLERLVLTNCKRLEKIPSHLEDVVSLKSIEVNWCSWSVANSAEEIQTTQHEDMANDAFTVTIQPPDWDRSGCYTCVGWLPSLPLNGILSSLYGLDNPPLYELASGDSFNSQQVPTFLRPVPHGKGRDRECLADFYSYGSRQAGLGSLPTGTALQSS